MNNFNEIFDKELDDYLSSMNQKVLNQYKLQSKFSEEIWNFNENKYDSNFNYWKEFHNICIDTKDINITLQETLIIHNLNYSKNIITQENKDKFNKLRTSKKLLNSTLGEYFIENPHKWRKNLIIEISKKTNIPEKTIYKWNWNKIKKTHN